ncbi:transcription factor bHLH25-like [Cynara cardunculus var. scolymus]|uniref:transcription factor bHLH25-like n=1 Tax=Cynara cardunculus var. scolymus TaxID=59895 RepID=UPI000D62E3EC|nr:transcription factor bHLH25-like [Cynara cardunculus var. scolymus]
MDIPSGAWLPELEMDDPLDFMYQHQSTCPYSELMDSFSSKGFKGHLNLATRNQSIQAATINGDMGKQENYNAYPTSSFDPICGSSSNSFTISFGDLDLPAEMSQDQLYGGYKLKYHDAIKPKEEMSLNELLGSIELPKRVSSTRRNPRQAQEHVLAERKRREKLTQRFFSLSALLPEIKKMDKATVLEDASRYIQHLQNQVKDLEETSIKKRSEFHACGLEDDASSFDETNSLLCSSDYNPGIRVRISGKNILVRIYCRRNSSPALMKALIEMERLHFTVMCNSVLHISDTASLITIIAQMNEEFVMAAIDLVKCLQSYLSSFLYYDMH